MNENTLKKLEVKRHIRSQHRENIGSIRDRERVLFGRPISQEFRGYREDELSKDTVENIGSTFKLRLFAATSAFIMYAIFSINSMGDSDAMLKIGSMPADGVVSAIDQSLEKDFSLEGLTIISDIEAAFGKR